MKNLIKEIVTELNKRHERPADFPKKEGYTVPYVSMTLGEFAGMNRQSLTRAIIATARKFIRNNTKLEWSSLDYWKGYDEKNLEVCQLAEKIIREIKSELNGDK